MKEFNLTLKPCRLDNQFTVEGSPFTEAGVRCSMEGNSKIILNGKVYKVFRSYRQSHTGRLRGKAYVMMTERGEELDRQLSEIWAWRENAGLDWRREETHEAMDVYAKEHYGLTRSEMIREKLEGREDIQIMENPQ